MHENIKKLQELAGDVSLKVSRRREVMENEGIPYDVLKNTTAGGQSKGKTYTLKTILLERLIDKMDEAISLCNDYNEVGL